MVKAKVDAFVQCSDDVMMYERAKRHMSKNTEAYQSFQLDIGPEPIREHS